MQFIELVRCEGAAGAPLVVTEDLLTTFNISLVVRGTVSETGASDNAEQARYAVPKEHGIMRCGPL